MIRIQDDARAGTALKQSETKKCKAGIFFFFFF